MKIGMNVILAVVVLIFLTGCQSVQKNSKPSSSRFEQDRFLISFWVDPPADEKMDQRYKEIKDAGFNAVIGGFGGNFGNKRMSQLEVTKKQIKYCKKYGLKLIAHARKDEVVALLNNDTCWGASVYDEPSASKFPQLRDIVAANRTKIPGKLTFINLFPSYSSEKQLGTASYEEHVRQFVETVDPDVLSMDNYPFMKPDKDTRKTYLYDLGMMRKYSLMKGIPFWNYFNIMPFGHHSDPTEAQVKWQVYSSLAYGAKGIMYFCYYTPIGPAFSKGGAIIDRQDRKTRHYYEAMRLNQELSNMGPILMKLTSTDVIRVVPTDDPASKLTGSPIKSMTKGNYLIGAFKHENGKRAVMLNNYEFAYTAWPTVEFDVPQEKVLEVCKQTGQIKPIIDDSPDMDGLQISLAAGEGRLFLLDD